MADAKEGLKKVTRFSCDDPKQLKIQKDSKGPFYDPEWELRCEIKPETVANIVALGVLESITVSDLDGTYWIVDGRRRYSHWTEACKEWKKLGEPIKPIICNVQRIKKELGDLIAVACNEHRLDDSPLKKIDRATSLLAIGHSEENVCHSFGISKQQLKNWLKSDSLCPAVKKLVEKGEIAITAATKFADLEPAQQKEEVEKLIESGVKPTVKAAIKAASGEKQERKGWTRKEFKDFCENEAMPSEFREFVKYAYFGEEDADLSDLKFLK